MIYYQKKSSSADKVVKKTKDELLEIAALNNRLQSIENKLDENKKYIPEISRFILGFSAINTLFLAVNLLFLSSIVRQHRVHQLNTGSEEKISGK